MELIGEVGGVRAPRVYAIQSSLEKSAYIGSTALTAYRRYAGHRSMLRGGRHHCRALQQAWDRLGEETFTMTILETVPASTPLLAAEFRWMEWFAANGYAIHNVQPLRCEGCSAPLRAHGRVRYCSPNCKLRSWRRRRKPPAPPASSEATP